MEHRTRLTVCLQRKIRRGFNGLNADSRVSRQFSCFVFSGGWMATYIVTGGAGFIGSHIAHELLSQRQVVKVVDNFSTGKHANIESIKDKVELINLDLADAPNLADVFRNVDYVIHQAA